MCTGVVLRRCFVPAPAYSGAMGDAHRLAIVLAAVVLVAAPVRSRASTGHRVVVAWDTPAIQGGSRRSTPPRRTPSRRPSSRSGRTASCAPHSASSTT